MVTRRAPLKTGKLRRQMCPFQLASPSKSSASSSHPQTYPQTRSPSGVFPQWARRVSAQDSKNKWHRSSWIRCHCLKFGAAFTAHQERHKRSAISSDAAVASFRGQPQCQQSSHKPQIEQRLQLNAFGQHHEMHCAQKDHNICQLV